MRLILVLVVGLSVACAPRVLIRPEPLIVDVGPPPAAEVAPVGLAWAPAFSDPFDGSECATRYRSWYSATHPSYAGDADPRALLESAMPHCVVAAERGEAELARSRYALVHLMWAERVAAQRAALSEHYNRIVDDLDELEALEREADALRRPIDAQGYADRLDALSAALDLPGDLRTAVAHARLVLARSDQSSAREAGRAWLMRLRRTVPDLGADAARRVEALMWLAHAEEEHGATVKAKKALQRAVEAGKDLPDGVPDWLWDAPQSRLAELALHLDDRRVAIVNALRVVHREHSRLRHGFGSGGLAAPYVARSLRVLAVLIAPHDIAALRLFARDPDLRVAIAAAVLDARHRWVDPDGLKLVWQEVERSAQERRNEQQPALLGPDETALASLDARTHAQRELAAILRSPEEIAAELHHGLARAFQDCAGAPRMSDAGDVAVVSRWTPVGRARPPRVQPPGHPSAACLRRAAAQREMPPGARVRAHLYLRVLRPE